MNSDPTIPHPDLPTPPPQPDPPGTPAPGRPPEPVHDPVPNPPPVHDPPPQPERDPPPAPPEPIDPPLHDPVPNPPPVRDPPPRPQQSRTAASERDPPLALLESWWRVLVRRLFERRAQRSVGMLVLVLPTALAIFGLLADAF
jgi:hypothetical protein